MWRIFGVALPGRGTGYLSLSLYVCPSCLVTVVVWVCPSWLLLSPPLPLSASAHLSASAQSGLCSALPFPSRLLLSPRLLLSSPSAQPSPCPLGFCSVRPLSSPPLPS